MNRPVSASVSRAMASSLVIVGSGPPGAGDVDASEGLVFTLPLDPETDIGRTVVFLCGPDAAYLTGNTICIDGGQAFLR